MLPVWPWPLSLPKHIGWVSSTPVSEGEGKSQLGSLGLVPTKRLGTQIPGVTSQWLLNAIQWRLIFVRDHYETSFMLSCRFLQIWGGLSISWKYVHLSLRSRDSIRCRGNRRAVLFYWRNMAFSQPIQCGLVTWLQDEEVLTIRFHSELTCFI